MAEAKMGQVADEIRERWPVVEGIAIVQRIGRLEAGTPTILIACTAAHRDTGVFEAARYGIDRLKEIVPVWKKEIGPDGQEWIEGEYHPQRGDLTQMPPSAVPNASPLTRLKVFHSSVHGAAVFMILTALLDLI